MPKPAPAIRAKLMQMHRQIGFVPVVKLVLLASLDKRPSDLGQIGFNALHLGFGPL